MKYHHDMTDKRIAALDRVLELVILMNEDMTKSLGARGLSTARTHLLWEVARTGPQSQRQLADALRVSPRNVTGLVDGMAADGWVTREPDPADRRAFLVTLTIKGRAAVDEMAVEQQEFAELLFGSMPATTLTGLTRGLDQVLATLRPLISQDLS